jgi:hypothetical protein
MVPLGYRIAIRRFRRMPREGRAGKGKTTKPRQLQAEFAVRTKPNKFESVGVGLPVNQHQVRSNVAIPE